MPWQSKPPRWALWYYQDFQLSKSLQSLRVINPKPWIRLFAILQSKDHEFLNIVCFWCPCRSYGLLWSMTAYGWAGRRAGSEQPREEKQLAYDDKITAVQRRLWRWQLGSNSLDNRDFIPGHAKHECTAEFSMTFRTTTAWCLWALTDAERPIFLMNFSCVAPRHSGWVWVDWVNGRVHNVWGELNKQSLNKCPTV